MSSKKIQIIEALRQLTASIKSWAENKFLTYNDIHYPVDSVNGKTGTINLTANDVGAIDLDQLNAIKNELNNIQIDPVGKQTSNNGEIFNDYTNNTAGSYAHSHGSKTHATGAYSHADGYNTTASGEASYSGGVDSIASQYASYASGFGALASGYFQTAIGAFNNEDTSAYFIVGNGTDDSKRANAFTVNNKGIVTASGTFQSAGADYAEYFEWVDGNKDGEDRVGYLVASDGEYIRKANDGDAIFGITSAMPAILGDTYDQYWCKKYLTDDFGRVQYEKIKSAEASTGFDVRPILNPDFDDNQPYIPRSKRKEWSPVGFMGKLYVRDDGTCVVGGYVKSGENGIATHSSTETNIRVLKRTKENIIYVFIK